MDTISKAREKDETMEELMGLFISSLERREEKLSVQLQNERERIMEVPLFKGKKEEDIQEWLFLMKQIMKREEMVEEEKVQLAICHLREDALK